MGPSVLRHTNKRRALAWLPPSVVYSSMPSPSSTDNLHQQPKPQPLARPYSKPLALSASTLAHKSEPLPLLPLRRPRRLSSSSSSSSSSSAPSSPEPDSKRQLRWAPVIERVVVYDPQDAAAACCMKKRPTTSSTLPRKTTFLSSLPSTTQIPSLLQYWPVLLEAVSTKGPLVATLRVRNIAFEKQVFVRYTLDGWATHCDVPATFHSQVDTESDRFCATISVPGDSRAEAQFALCYKVSGAIFWDSAEGENYRFCVA